MSTGENYHAHQCSHSPTHRYGVDAFFYYCKNSGLANAKDSTTCVNCGEAINPPSELEGTAFSLLYCITLFLSFGLSSLLYLYTSKYSQLENSFALILLLVATVPFPYVLEKIMVAAILSCGKWRSKEDSIVECSVDNIHFILMRTLRHNAVTFIRVVGSMILLKISLALPLSIVTGWSLFTAFRSCGWKRIVGLALSAVSIILCCSFGFWWPITFAVDVGYVCLILLLGIFAGFGTEVRE